MGGLRSSGCDGPETARAVVRDDGMGAAPGDAVLLRKIRLCRPIRAPRDGAREGLTRYPGFQRRPRSGSAAVARGYTDAARPKDGRATRATGCNFASGRFGTVPGENSASPSRLRHRLHHVVQSSRLCKECTRSGRPVHPTRLPQIPIRIHSNTNVKGADQAVPMCPVSQNHGRSRTDRTARFTRPSRKCTRSS